MTFRIDGLWAWVAVDDDDEEGVIAALIGDTFMPLVAADRERLEDLRPYAHLAAMEARKPVVLVRFDVRTEVERIEP